MAVPSCSYSLPLGVPISLLYDALTLGEDAPTRFNRDRIPEESKLMCRRNRHGEILGNTHERFAIGNRQLVPAATGSLHHVPGMTVFRTSWET